MAWLYVEAKLKKESKLCKIRNEIYDEADAYYYYDKKSPHITLVPPFWANSFGKGEINSLLDEYDFEGKDVEVNDLKLWESIDQPDYVMLDVDADLNGDIDELVSDIRELDAVSVNKPVPFHITLFSNSGWWEEPAMKLKRNLKEQVEQFDESLQTEIKYVKASTTT